MAYFLFIDESGQDHKDSPYEVLTGIAIKDSTLWNLIRAIQEAEIRHFGIRYSQGTRELKGKKLLKKKAFAHAAMLPPIPGEERTLLAKSCLENGPAAGKREMAALAQAKLAYVKEVFEICARHECRVFASIVADKEHCDHNAEYLRKDYSYLFERFFYFLEDVDSSASGIVVFDELEKSKSHILLGQMDRYFKLTAKGRRRAEQIIPEPFFVHSDLTTGIQVADLAAYIISWGFRTKNLTEPRREELGVFVDTISRLRHQAERSVEGIKGFKIRSFGVIKDLRSGKQAGRG
ncbi:DUF3800 domain-containing protein [Geobacter sp.]|uniref:DUF3800 domain-containing protein n=1 Tax=Geobacter sp. TaxID=46610 RepID=UPI002634A716|nr:DUF3800 domain-containing protein [Geobacter sp.]